MIDDENDIGTEDEQILAEAKCQFTRCEDWEATARANAMDDVKFGNGDDINKFQWPDAVATQREIDRKPMMTVNKTQVHCDQIINDSRQNKAGIEVRPTGGGASVDGSLVYEGIVRHIEYISRAQQAYDAANWWQVYGGWGYVRVLVDYIDQDSFDQDVFIQRVGDPMTIYLDPDIQQFDGSDAKFGFVFKNTPRDEIRAKYPELAEEFDTLPFGQGDSWDNKDHVRECEYFRVGEKTDELILLPDDFAAQIGAPPGTSLRKSQMPKDMLKSIPKDARRRKISEPDIEWFKIIGNKIADRKPWLGKYIPISRCVGKEIVIDGILDRKSHVRCLRDAQRFYNYHASGAVEFVALQTKTPWLTSVRAIEGVETYWQTANTVNHAYLPWNDIDDNGQPIARPERTAPPTSASGHIQGMQSAQEQMMLASGQYQAVMGAPSNETSGKAINARQRQGDNATYHFIDHQASMIAHVGRIVLDLIPKVYDTPRIIKILGVDDTQMAVQIDPNAPQAHQQVQDPDSDEFDPEKIAAIFNPSVGKYDIMSDVGPSYETGRQEAFNAFSQIIAQNPAAFTLVGDLWADAADFPGAEAMAKRLKNMIPPQAKGADPAMEQLHQQMNQGAQQALQHIDGLQKQIADLTQKLSDRSEDTDAKRYDAETKRMAVIAQIDPNVLKPFVRAEATEIMGHPIMDVVHAHAMNDAASAAAAAPQPMPGAPPQPQGAPMNG